MKYVYPAILSPEPEGGYSVVFPDLRGCVTQGDDLAEALYMATDALAGWIYTAEKRGLEIPAPSTSGALALDPGSFSSLIVADIDAYRRTVESFAVKKTLTIPSWLNEKAEAANVNYSKLLQDALQQHLGL